jgi:hypothetical protein
MSWGSFSAALAQHLALLLGSLSKHNFNSVSEEVASLAAEYGNEAYVVLLRHLLEALDPHAPANDDSRALKLQLLHDSVDALVRRPVSSRETRLGRTRLAPTGHIR